MSQNTPARWLITYDIRDPKRLAKVFKALKKEGIPVQYSVFYMNLSTAKVGSLMVKLAKLIDPRDDDVRAYRLPERGAEITLGSSILPRETWHDANAPIVANQSGTTTDHPTGSTSQQNLVDPFAKLLSEQAK
jgi:CRISPR-associated protein Cas2